MTSQPTYIDLLHIRSDARKLVAENRAEIARLTTAIWESDHAVHATTADFAIHHVGHLQEVGLTCVREFWGIDKSEAVLPEHIPSSHLWLLGEVTLKMFSVNGIEMTVFVPDVKPYVLFLPARYFPMNDSMFQIEIKEVLKHAHPSISKAVAAK